MVVKTVGFETHPYVAFKIIEVLKHIFFKTIVLWLKFCENKLKQVFGEQPFELMFVAETNLFVSKANLDAHRPWTGIDTISGSV